MQCIGSKHLVGGYRFELTGYRFPRFAGVSYRSQPEGVSFSNVLLHIIIAFIFMCVFCDRVFFVCVSSLLSFCVLCLCALQRFPRFCKMLGYRFPRYCRGIVLHLRGIVLHVFAGVSSSAGGVSFSTFL